MFLLKNTFKVALQYLFSVFILFNIVYNLKLNFKIKIDSKMRTFKNLEEIWNTWKKIEKMSGNPVYDSKMYKLFLSWGKFTFKLLKNYYLINIY